MVKTTIPSWYSAPAAALSDVLVPLALAAVPSVPALAPAVACTAMAEAEAANSKFPLVNLSRAPASWKKMTWL
jgi:hypothetical protein